MTTQDRIIEIGAWCLENGHRTLHRLSGGRFPKRLMGMEPIELHVKGLKSGITRNTMLTAPICEDDRIVVVASKGGHSDHPDWYKNLVANPEIEITVRGRTAPYLARTADAAEKAELWPRITATYKGYASYQSHTERNIPVVICTPRSVT